MTMMTTVCIALFCCDSRRISASSRSTSSVRGSCGLSSFATTAGRADTTVEDASEVGMKGGDGEEGGTKGSSCHTSVSSKAMVFY